VKGYSNLTTAQEAASRLREQGHNVKINVRNGWYVIELDTPPPNDNAAPPEPPEAA